LPNMTERTQKEIEPFCLLLQKCIWCGEGYRDGQVFKTWGIAYVPDPCEARSGMGGTCATRDMVAGREMAVHKRNSTERAIL